MDAPNPSSQTTMASITPLRIGAYWLVVRDLDRCADFYREAVGLDLLERSADTAVLGIDGIALLHLQHRPGAIPDDPAEAGMFHAAFAMPTRRDLANWHAHAVRTGVTIQRTGDHLINEAIYFDDPEGNGCECYADRPPESWTWYPDGTRRIRTGMPIDMPTLLAEADPAATSWRSPPGLRVGHVNLRIGDVAEGERFWRDGVGLDHVGRSDVTTGGRQRTITFLSSGQYHHHIGANDFTSRGAGPRNPDRAGLAWVAVEAQDQAGLETVRQGLTGAGFAVMPRADGFETRDPWGTPVRFTLRTW